MSGLGLTRMPEWQTLVRHRDRLKTSPLSSLVLGDKKRIENCTLALDGLRLVYALNWATPETLSLLERLAEARGVPEWRARMWAGDKINNTENRAALHVLLRQQDDEPAGVDGRDVIPEIRETRKRVYAFAESVRSGDYLGVDQRPIRHVVNIGIGGSDLGPRMVVRALDSFTDGPETHFVANADVFELKQLFKKVDPAETLFVVVSKTFTTQETLLNAHTAREWLVGQLGEGAVEQHFAAVSTNIEAVRAFGIAPEHIFPMWDWVGGRFSLWSAVGLSIVLAIGEKNFDRLLQGAAAMDAHFLTAPLARNMPVVLAMLGIWSRNFFGHATHVVLPYSERLRELPRYLQQLEMESNGKSVGRDGRPVEAATTPALFGEPGTVGQHGFHQWLHQGVEPVSVDFVGVAADDLGGPEHHAALLSNMAAQAAALTFGQAEADVPQDVYPGNRGSNLLMLDRLDPYHLGMLLALYEHKVFVQSIIWGINPFDQPGVELGKRMARILASGVTGSDARGSFLSDLYQSMLIR